MLGYKGLAGILSGFLGSSFRRRWLLRRDGVIAPYRFGGSFIETALPCGLCEVLASTDHPIRFGPVSTFATSTFA